MFAGVIVDVRSSKVDRLFHYRIPDNLRDNLKIGHRVLVPFGPRKIEGYVLDFTDTPDVDESKIKGIIDILDPHPLLRAEQIETARWIATHYVGLLSEALQLFLPPGFRYGKERVGWKTHIVVVPKEKAMVDHYLANLSTRATKQRAVLDYLQKHGVTPLRSLVEKTGAGFGVVRVLEQNGIVEKKEEVTNRKITLNLEDTPKPQLTAAQREALKVVLSELNAVKKRPVLLHGVTGSGKTEVYLQAIERVVLQGKQAIVLVPEIALTAQTIGRFRSRFGDRIAVWHSGLSEGERFEQWWQIYRGEVDIVIGARSGVFAPVGNLGLIVLDEEHETTFKQDEGSLKYHTRQVALRRARLNQALVVLGSATPSLESFHQASIGNFSLVSLPERVLNRPLPDTLRVDMRAEFNKGNRSMFSEQLADALTDTLQSGDKAIIFLNRRGFASFLLCRECGFVVECANCQVSLTYHQTDGRLHCHYCNSMSQLPQSCPKCGSAYLRQFGSGTQQVEEYVKQQFPTALPVRMDTDTTSRKGAHQRLLDQFRSGKKNVLIGTQMIAKGLDFPDVTLVGILSADLSLNFPDFRAAERTYQLLTQVAGRAGRGRKAGKVVIQSYDPENYVLQAVENKDYLGFCRRELAFRKEMGYPPFGQLVRLLCSGPQKETEGFCQVLATHLRSKLRAETVFGPSPAPISRIKGRYRYQIVLKSIHPLQSILRDLPPVHSQVTLGIDIEPMFLL